jgi:8-oxo-dGTP pyrophosphatase MutT (NUDIX family)
MYKKIGKTGVLIENKWWKYKLDKFKLPNGDMREYHYLETTPKHSVICIPKYSDNEFLMVLQYRYLFNQYCIEFPGGFVDLNIHEPIEGFSENANHELREETGFSATCIEELGEVIPYKGLSNEVSYIYLMELLQYDPLPKEETEFCELLVFTPEQIDRLIAINKITDGFTITAWKMYQEMSKNLY